MGFGQAIQRLSQITWPEAFGRDSAKPKSGEERSRSFNPAGAETPEEALAYIRQLSKAGRTEEVVGLLRRSPAFREAWQALQQFSPTGPEAAGGLASVTPAPDQSGRPSPPGAVPASLLPSPVPELPAPKITAVSGISPEHPAAQTYPVLAPRPSRPLAAARQVYETQQRYYLEGQDRRPRISVRV